MPPKCLEIRGVGGIDLYAYESRITGWVGTTARVALELFVGLKRSDESEIKVWGKVLERNFPSLKAKVGFLVGDPYFNRTVSGFENLRILGGFGSSPQEEVIERYLLLVGLSADEAVATYDDSMRKRLGIVQAVMEDQQLILLEEPFEHLVPQEKNLVKDLLLQLRDEGKTIVIVACEPCPWLEICDEIIEIKGGISDD